MTTAAPTRGAVIMAWLVVVLTVVFLTLGLVWYGVSWEVNQRIWRDIFGRTDGPMTFRFVLQPAMAGIVALHDGIRDAQGGRAPYLRTVLSDPAKRTARLREGLLSIARIILLGFGMDAIYQWRVLGVFYPVEAIIITLILAVVPYVILRGPIDRIARWWMARHASSPAGQN